MLVAEIHKIANADKRPWSSYLDYIGKRNGNLCNKQNVLKEFKDVDEYISLTKEVIKNSQDIKSELKEYYLE